MANLSVRPGFLSLKLGLVAAAIMSALVESFLANKEEEITMKKLSAITGETTESIQAAVRELIYAGVLSASDSMENVDSFLVGSLRLEINPAQKRLPINKSATLDRKTSGTDQSYCHAQQLSVLGFVDSTGFGDTPWNLKVFRITEEDPNGEPTPHLDLYFETQEQAWQHFDDYNAPAPQQPTLTVEDGTVVEEEDHEQESGRTRSRRERKQKSQTESQAA